MLRPIKRHYFNWGWLLIAWLPFLQIVGRAAFNIVGTVTLAWAIVALAGSRFRLDRRLLLPYLVLVVSFLLSIAVAGDRAIAWHRWYEYFLYTLFCLVTLATLQQVDEGVERCLRQLGWSGLAMLVLLYLWLIVQVQRPGFTPETVMREDNLPLLAPFMLYLIQFVFRQRHRAWIASFVLLSTFGYIIGANGRAALVGLCVGLLAYSRLVLGWRLRYTLPLALLAVAAAVSLHHGTLAESKQAGSALTRKLDELSTYRTAMWRHALSHPPANLWLGVGMGNVSEHPDILTVPLADHTEIQVGKHLHNFILDCWYANGTVGLAALLIWLGGLTWRGLTNWRQAEGLVRIRLGALLSAAFAIMSNAFLSYSYGSKQFGVFLFTFLVMAAWAPSLQARDRSHET